MFSGNLTPFTVVLAVLFVVYGCRLGGYLLLRLFSGEILKLRMKLSQMFEEIQKYPEFIKVGASYAVNLDFVRRISGNNIAMQGGVKIPVPRRSIEEVRSVYMEFCRKETEK